MFTGIIEETGKIKSINSGELSVTCRLVMEDAKIGDSIAINGTCLTIIKIGSNFLSFHVSPTTTRYTMFNHSEMRIGETVNLERALTLNTRLGGHIVTGHIDGRAKIIDKRRQGSDYFMEFTYPENLKKLIAPKGSVALDGISLTVSEILSSSFIIAVIPHTVESTNLRDKKIGDHVHIEADILGRYIYNIYINGGFDEQNRTAFERFCRW